MDVDLFEQEVVACEFVSVQVENMISISLLTYLCLLLDFDPDVQF